MNKAIALAALTAIAFGNETFSENEFNVLKSIGNGLKKAGHFVEEHPQIITQGAKLLSHHDDEYFNIHDTIHKAEEGIHKAEHYVYDHRQQIKDGAKKGINYIAEHPEVVNKAIEIIKNLKHHDDEELFNVGHAIHNVAHAIGKVEHVVKDGVNVYKDVQTGNLGGLIHDGKSLVHDVKHHDDEELFKVGKLVHEVTHAAGKVEHVAKDGMNMYKDYQTGNYIGLVKDGAKTVHDVKHHDDEELFNIHNAVHKVEDGAKKAGHYVAEHPEVINKAIDLIKAIRQHDDEELFNVGHAIHNVVHTVGKVEHVVKDGLNVYKDVQTGNIGGLIHDGKSLVHDVKHHDDEELFNLDAFLNDAVKTYNDARQTPRNYGNLVNDGIQIVKDIKQKKHDDEELFKLDAFLNDAVKTYNDVRQQPRNYGNIVNDGISLVKDIKQKNHDDEELFNIHNAVHKVEDGAKKAGHYVAEHPEVINKAIDLIKAIRQHDDEELFNVGHAIHNVAHTVGKVEHVVKDGLNVYKDVQTGNIGGLIHDGKSLVHDVKHHDDEELFKVGHAIHNVVHAVGKVEHVVKDGLNVYKDVQTGNIGGLIHDGKSLVHDVKQHDDEELFNLGNLINDGIHIVKDVKTHNYGGLVNDGIQTVKDVKQAKKNLRH